MTKDQIPDNEAASQLVKSFQETSKAVVDSVAATQEHNTKVAQSAFMDWLETLKGHTESIRMLMQEMEEQTQKQQEAFRTLAHESVDVYFDFLHTPFSFYPQSLQLNESLQICLLALDSRYPRNIVDINEEVLGPQSLGAEGWTASDIIELFQNTAPQMLQAKARVVVNAQRRGIYLIELSEEKPALRIHCGEWGEKVPPYKGNMAARQENQASGHGKVQMEA